MHHVATFFEDFLNEISPTDAQCEEMDEAHQAVISHLRSTKLLKHIWVKSFVQGSYRRDTGLIGTEQHPCDIDVVVVTKLPDVLLPAFALELFNAPIGEFCEAQNAKTKSQLCHKLQGRSWGVRVKPTINLDIVPTSSVEEAWTVPLVDDEHTAVKLAAEASAGRKSMLALMEENFSFRGARAQARPGVGRQQLGTPINNPASEIRVFLEKRLHDATVKAAGESHSATSGGTIIPGALRIPDHAMEKWVATHPLGQINWTTQKNQRCNGHFTKVVRSLKWWKRERVTDCERPKGYPLERLIAECCPDGITSIADGVAKTFDAIIQKFGTQIDQGICPVIFDHGTTANVMKRLLIADWKKIIAQVRKAHVIAQRAVNASETHEATICWHEIFGDKFPKPPSTGPSKAPVVPTHFTGSDNSKQPTPKTYA